MSDGDFQTLREQQIRNKVDDFTRAFVRKYPNDADLGAVIRSLFDKKEEEDGRADSITNKESKGSSKEST